MNKKGQAGIAILVIVGVIVAGVAIYFAALGLKAAFFPVKVAQANIDSGYQIVDKTMNAQNAISNYEWFKKQYEDIKAMENQIDNTKSQVDQFKSTYGNVSTWDKDTKLEYNRLSTVLLGQKNQYETMVADYNARSKMANRNIFNDQLPFNVQKKLWIWQ